MPGDSVTVSGGKLKAMMWRRSRSSGGENENVVLTRYRVDSALPEDVRKRLHELFGRIEQEFDKLYSENIALQEKIEILNERLENCIVIGDKPDSSGGPAYDENGQKPAKKVSQFSQKIRSTYKTSTSRIANTFKATGCGQYVRDFRGHLDGVWDVSVSKGCSQQFIGTASADFTAKVWSADTGTIYLEYYGHRGSVNSIRFHPFSDLVVTGSGDQTAHVWKLQSSPAVMSVSSAPSLLQLQLMPGLAQTDSHRVSSDEDFEESAADVAADGGGTGNGCGSVRYVHSPLVRLGGHTDVVVAAEWLCDGQRIVTASWDGSAIVHDVERDSAQTVDTLCGHENELTNVCAHSSQKLLLTASKDMSLRLWDLRLASSVPVNAFLGHTASVSSAVFAPGDKIISGSNDRTVKLWDMRNMAAPYATIRSDSAVNRLSVCAQTGIIAVPHDNRHIRLYDTSGARLGRMPHSSRQGHTRMVCAVAWAEDSTSGSPPAGASCNLYSCGFDRLVLGWHVSTKPDTKEGNTSKK